MKSQIRQYVLEMSDELIALRRDFHKYAETAWTEFRTASIVAAKLEALGYEVSLGEAVINQESMMGVPEASVLMQHMERARMQGAAEQYLNKMQGGKTGVVGILRTSNPGPTIALRFDMDANDIDEIQSQSHRPHREGFASVAPGVMHACGHDGHTAIGLGVAKTLAILRNQLTGTIKLIFQPAEEGVRGARAMADAGIVDDVDFLIGMHLGFFAKTKDVLICGSEGFLATTKLDVRFVGTPAHAGASPEKGCNAMLAAANAVINLHAISRHSEGASRINVGFLQAGSGRNIVPANAVLKLETRGATTEINEYVKAAVLRILQGAADMYGVTVEVQEMGDAVGGKSDAEFSQNVRKTAEEAGLFSSIIDSGSFGGSEDFTYFMQRVQQRGGQAVYLMIGTSIAAGHHDSSFDFDETVLATAVELLTLLTLKSVVKANII